MRQAPYKIGSTVHGFTILGLSTHTGTGNNSRYYQVLCPKCGDSFLICSGKMKKQQSCGCIARNHGKFADRSGLRSAYNAFKNNHKRDANRMLSLEEFRELAMLDCDYCGAPPTNTTKNQQTQYQGLDRVDNNGGCLTDNLVPSCFECNWTKSDRTLDEFQAHVMRMAVHMFTPEDFEHAYKTKHDLW